MNADVLAELERAQDNFRRAMDLYESEKLQRETAEMAVSELQDVIDDLHGIVTNEQRGPSAMETIIDRINQAQQNASRVAAPLRVRVETMAKQIETQAGMLYSLAGALAAATYQMDERAEPLREGEKIVPICANHGCGETLMRAEDAEFVYVRSYEGDPGGVRTFCKPCAAKIRGN